jgi:hypothetical protein
VGPNQEGEIIMLYYKDFETGQTRRTFGQPVGIRRDGVLNAWGLVVVNRASELWIPEYCLEGASRAHFNLYKTKREAQQA